MHMGLIARQMHLVILIDNTNSSDSNYYVSHPLREVLF